MVSEPAAAAFAEALDELWENRDEARRLGKGGRDFYATLGISWKNVVGKSRIPHRACDRQPGVG